jgi:ankyrin repeat protein
MHVAAAHGNIAVIELLAQHHANLSPVDNFGGTPLDDAVRRKQDDAAKLLHEDGAKHGSSSKVDGAADGVGHTTVPMSETTMV